MTLIWVKQTNSLFQKTIPQKAKADTGQQKVDLTKLDCSKDDKSPGYVKKKNLLINSKKVFCH